MHMPKDTVTVRIDAEKRAVLDRLRAAGMRLRYTQLAWADLMEARAFIHAEKARAGKAVMARIREAVERLGRFPEPGRPRRIPGTRELVLASTPFVVAYRVTTEAVDVLAVIHTSRRWPSSFG